MHYNTEVNIKIMYIYVCCYSKYEETYHNILFSTKGNYNPLFSSQIYLIKYIDVSTIINNIFLQGRKYIIY